MPISRFIQPVIFRNGRSDGARWNRGVPENILYIRAPRPELYDLSADPGATRNLAQSSKATLETIAGQLDAFDRRFSDPGQCCGRV